MGSSEAISKGSVQAINYFVANNYVKALEAIAKSPNQKILMMPLEASAVIGSRLAWPRSPRKLSPEWCRRYARGFHANPEGSVPPA